MEGISDLVGVGKTHTMLYIISDLKLSKNDHVYMLVNISKEEDERSPASYTIP